MNRLFGTDGVRGIPGRYPLVPELVRRLGAVVAEVLLRRRSRHGGPNGSAPLVLMARDSRGSGAALERILAQGFAAAGCRSASIGIIPTPSLAYLVPRRNALCGVMVSASHNPAEFNGIKFMTADGFKMGTDIEKEVEDRLSAPRSIKAVPVKIAKDEAGVGEYEDFLRSTFPAHLDLCGKRVVVDCANGAAYKIAPRLLRLLGAQVHAIGCDPDGTNINSGCGALDTRAMQREVSRRNCDCGFSLDGDADRAIFADAGGAVCDGDVLISMAAIDLQERGLLSGNKVVLTVMSNYGLIRFLESRGISVVQVPVGDRNVTEAIEREALSLGGENSGHIVYRRFCCTGDGLLTALQTLAVLARTGRDLGAFRKRYRVYPQLLRNIRVDVRVPLDQLHHLSRKILDAQRQLEGKGRVLVRYSGTEPLLRVLVEGPERSLVHRISDAIISSARQELCALQTH